MLYELGQIITSAQPGKDAVSLPTPGDNFLTCEVSREVPTVFLRITFDATMEAVIVSPKRDQHSFLDFPHGCNAG